MTKLRRSVIALAATFGVVAAGGTARADEATSRRDPTPALGVAMHVGLGTPYGDIGAALEYDPVAWFVISTGGGFSTSGPQWAVMPRVRIPEVGVGVGAGVSGGPFTWHSCYVCVLDEDVQKKWTHALWANLEASYESDPRAALRLRGYFGLAFLLDPAAYSSCATSSGAHVACSTTNGVFPYAGLAIVGDIVH